ncbi:uncharacterized protein LOC144150839 [Haemaphysalis longicornis]
MSSHRAVIAAEASRGNRSEGNEEQDYQIILPTLPTGRIVSNTVFLHADVKGRPYRVEDFRDALAQHGALPEVISLGAYQINHVWAVTFKNADATRKMLAATEMVVKGRRCLVIDPQNQEVKLKLHWLLYGVADEDIRSAFSTYGSVSEVTRERWRVAGVNEKTSTTRTVLLKLKSGLKLGDLPHQIRVAGELALVVAPGRPMQCLRCHGEGHVRRECKVPRCSRCRRFGHTDTHCERSYASAVGPAGTDLATEYIMDAAEAAEAAKGSGDLGPEEAADETKDEAIAAAGGGDSGATGKPVDAGDLSKDGVTRTDNHLTASQNPDAMEVTETTVAKRAHVDVAEGDANDITAQADEPPMKATPGRRSTTRLKTNVSERRTTGVAVSASTHLYDPGPKGVP